MDALRRGDMALTRLDGEFHSTWGAQLPPGLPPNDPGGSRTPNLLIKSHGENTLNHGKKRRKSLLGCTVCRSCRFAMPGSAGVQQRENGIEWRELWRES